MFRSIIHYGIKKHTIYCDRDNSDNVLAFCFVLYLCESWTVENIYLKLLCFFLFKIGNSTFIGTGLFSKILTIERLITIPIFSQ